MAGTPTHNGTNTHHATGTPPQSKVKDRRCRNTYTKPGNEPQSKREAQTQPAKTASRPSHRPRTVHSPGHQARKQEEPQPAKTQPATAHQQPPPARGPAAATTATASAKRRQPQPKSARPSNSPAHAPEGRRHRHLPGGAADATPSCQHQPPRTPATAKPKRINHREVHNTTQWKK